MNPVIVIPSYWAAGPANRELAQYDHTCPLDAEHPELDRCLASLEQVRGLDAVVVLAVCPVAERAQVAARIRQILAAHPAVPAVVVTGDEAACVQALVSERFPELELEGVSLRGYGAIRNMGLACACAMGRDLVVFLDDDEVVLDADFLAKASYGLGQQTRQGLPILAKTGYFYDRSGSPLANTSRARWSDTWWTKRASFNEWMRRALSGTRISRSNTVCGGCFALHARAFTRVPFDPVITRGEDLDYLLNMRLQGMDVWFDNVWAVKHLPPDDGDVAPRFVQNVYRWYYEREKLRWSAARPDLAPVSPRSLMPYPGPFLGDELDEKVARTALARAVATDEKAAYLEVWRHGREEALSYARRNAGAYARFQSFWPALTTALWGNARIARELGVDSVEGGR